MSVQFDCSVEAITELLEIERERRPDLEGRVFVTVSFPARLVDRIAVGGQITLVVPEGSL